MATAVIEADVREGTYGDKVAAVEPGGAEFIPLSERHGTPLQQFWTWVSPNMEFATIFVGVIGVWFFGQSFWMASLAILLGSALGSLSMGALAARGPLFGVPQMVLSRIGFGFLGNILPAGINAVVAGIGWFAVNSVSGAFALNALLGWNTKICLLIIVLVQVAVAFFGHNLVHAFERWSFPFLVVVFALASVVILSKSHPGAHVAGVPGGFLITFGAAFGYAAGWNPYASDYTRYLPKDTNRAATGLWAGLGVFVSCVALEVVGAAAATITSVGKFADNPTAGFTVHLPTTLADVTLLAIALGAVCANALNVYSGSVSSVSSWRCPACTTPEPSTTTSCWSSRTGSARGSVSSSPTNSCGAASGSTDSSSTASTTRGPASRRWPSRWRSRSTSSQIRPTTSALSRRTTRISATSTSRSDSCLPRCSTRSSSGCRARVAAKIHSCAPPRNPHSLPARRPPA